MSNKHSDSAQGRGGTLYVVATPIGNLDDISRRAIATLSSVDFIAAEDTRHSRKLLQHLQIQTPLLAYHDHSTAADTERLLQRLGAGESAALISDAGTPLVSDPGYRLVRGAREAGIEVLPIPGPSAVLAALSVAGLASDRFVFEGFLPAKAAARDSRLAELADEPRSLVFFESPRRVADSLAALAERFGPGRQLFLAREISKQFEQHFSGSLAEAQPWLQADANRQRGEFVLVLSGAEPDEAERRARREALGLLARVQEDLPLKKAVKLVSELSGVRRNWLYEQALAAKRQAGEDESGNE